MWQMKPEMQMKIHLWQYIISAAVAHTTLALVLLMSVVKVAGVSPLQLRINYPYLS